MNRAMHLISGLLIPAIVFWCGNSRAVELKQSELERDRHQIRFGDAAAAFNGPTSVFVAAAAQNLNDLSDQPVGQKSPLKAFLLSAVVPGAGQFYMGSRVKAAAFLGADVAAWLLHFKYQGDGDDATDAYKAFNHLHWSRSDYEDKYLWWAYGVTDDDSIPSSAREISHHLPDDITQQYYEMTGKYNQFAWGWDDARRSGLDLDAFFRDSVLQFGQGRIVSDATTPYSAHRLQYEGMRNDANKKYDKARTWTYVAIVNHLISGFEAYFSAKRHNRDNATTSEFSRIDVDVSVKSYHSRRDTPYLKLSYKF